MTQVTALEVQVEVLDSALGTPRFWEDAARVVSRGVYVGGKPMHLSVVGKCNASGDLWTRLR